MILPINTAAGVRIGLLARCWIEFQAKELTPVHVGDVILLACTETPVAVVIQIMLMITGLVFFENLTFLT